MFCHKCGTEIEDDAVVCVHCGVSTKNMKKETSEQQIVINNSANASAAASVVTNSGNVDTPFKSKTVAAVLCFFFGYLGIHRFYVGQTGMGLLYLFTVGLCGIGALVDFVQILLGNFKDTFGRPLK